MLLSEMKLTFTPAEASAVIYRLSTNFGLACTVLPYHGKEGSLRLRTSCCQANFSLDRDEVWSCSACSSLVAPRGGQAALDVVHDEEVARAWVEPYFDPLTCLVAGDLIVDEVRKFCERVRR